MNARLRLVKDDGSLASVRDLFEMKELVALDGNVVAFTAVDVCDAIAYSWHANTPEQREARSKEAELQAIRILDDAKVALARLQEEANDAINRIGSHVPLIVRR